MALLFGGSGEVFLWIRRHNSVSVGIWILSAPGKLHMALHMDTLLETIVSEHHIQLYIYESIRQLSCADTHLPELNC